MELRLLLVATGRRPNTGSLGYRRDRGSVSRWRGTQLNGSENVDVRARVGQRFPIPDQRRTGQCRSAVRQDVILPVQFRLGKGFERPPGPNS